MKIGVNCGHTLTGAGYGASGLLEESIHTRLAGYALMKKLEAAGVNTVDCTVDQAECQKEYLAAVTDLANCSKLDWFISIHFNASAEHDGNGCEVYTYKGKHYPEALQICNNLEKLGFCNRGIKDGSRLAVIRGTNAKAILVEVCFCDNPHDVDIYNCMGAGEEAAQAILDGLCPERVKTDLATEDNQDIKFEEFVGEIAARDWEEHHIILPSVVVAQAMKESARGTSELAQKANALFGIKKNGWRGRIYTKSAAEQRLDGSYYTVDDTEWRAYDSWEQSILDHNNYIATRTTDGGKSLRYAPVIGCDNYKMACQYLQECGYATSNSYGVSLEKDYIEKYELFRFDKKLKE